jgi:hypothetical protein
MLPVGGRQDFVLAPKSRIAWLAVLAVVCGGRDAAAAEAGTPLFNAFQRFCADSGARADDVKRAVLAAGGVAHDPPTKSTQTPFAMETTLWDVKAGGQPLVVAAGRAHTTGAAEMAMTDCVISGNAVDAASLTALAGWAGVPANANANERLTYYVFEDKNGAHRTVADAKAAEAAGRIWRLTIIRAPGIVSVELMHLLGKGE